MEETFDGAARVKNMFAFPHEQAKTQLHYRTYMVNTVWPPPSGKYQRTFRELLETARPMWDAYENTVHVDGAFAPCRFQNHIKQARSHLERLAADNVPLQFICESQILLSPYLEGRKVMHLLYKVLRSETDKALHKDFSSVEQLSVLPHQNCCSQDDAVLRLKKKMVPTSDGEKQNPIKQVVLKNECYKGHYKAVEYLLKQGLNVNATYDKGSSALNVAADQGHRQCVEVLIAAGADVNHRRTLDGVTSLYNCCNNGHLDVVMTLLGAGCDVNLANDNQVTPLMRACSSGHTDVVKVVCAHPDVKLDQTNASGVTPLFIAAQKGHADVVEVLLRSGADTIHGNGHGAKPIKIAKQKGWGDVVELLERQW
jgi:ankyrin repeat protein